MTGNEKIVSKVMLLSLVIDLVLCFIMIPKYGIYGAAFSAVITQVIWNSIFTYLIWKRYGTTLLYIPGINFLRKRLS